MHPRGLTQGYSEPRVFLKSRDGAGGDAAERTGEDANHTYSAGDGRSRKATQQARRRGRWLYGEADIGNEERDLAIGERAETREREKGDGRRDNDGEHNRKSKLGRIIFFAVCVSSGL